MTLSLSEEKLEITDNIIEMLIGTCGFRSALSNVGSNSALSVRHSSNARRNSQIASDIC
jgi:hypothetical protein